MAVVPCHIARNTVPMLTHLYIEALLVDEELADEVWEAWDTGEIDDEIVWLAWRLITNLRDVSMA